MVPPGDRGRAGQPENVLLLGGRGRPHDAVEEAEQVAGRGPSRPDRGVPAAPGGLAPALSHACSGLV